MTASQVDLRKGFDAFIEAGRRLEKSYATLKARADAVDLELANTNRALDHALKEREAIFAALPIGLLALDAQGTLTWCNPEAKRLREHAESRGMNIVDVPEGEIAGNGLTVRIRRIDMGDRGVLVVLEDRSRVAHLEREVHRLDRLAGLSELALGIAHEIKNPLNGVMGFASLMERGPEPDKAMLYAEKIRAGLVQVDAIVKGLLAFARPRGKEVQVSTLQAIVKEAAGCSGVPVSRITTNGDLHERADGSALVRVLDNLFRNSLEAVGEDVTIGVIARSRKEVLEISVRDNGPGVSSELGPKVFEPFVSSKKRGHGLGLALAARVMSFLGGSLELMNPGKTGAEFRICVPRLDGDA